MVFVSMPEVYSRFWEQSNHKREQNNAMIPKMGKTTVDILADNLRRNCGPGKRFETIVDLGKRAGVGKSTIDRLMKGESAARINNLEAIANAYRLHPWQLLVPNLDVRNPPQLRSEGLSSEAALMLDLFDRLDEKGRKSAIAMASELTSDKSDSNENKSRSSPAA